MLEKAELTLISMLSKTKKVITTPPPVLCSVASYKLFYSTTWSVGILSLLFVPPVEGGGMEISMIQTKSRQNLFMGSILAVIIFVFNIRNINQLIMPAIVGDEFGYWATAATFIGYDWSALASSFSSYYGYGYGMILAILMLIFRNMKLVYQAAIILNCLMAVGVFLLAYLTMKKLFLKQSSMIIMICCFVAVFYPSIQHNTQFAWCETYLCFVYQVLMYFVVQYLNTKKAAYLIFISINSVYLYMIHQRCIGITIITIVAVFIISNLIKKKFVLSCICFCTISVMLLGHCLFKDFQKESLWENSDNVIHFELEEEDSEAEIDVNDFSGQVWRIKAIFSKMGIKYLFIGIFGKIFYFGLSSFFIGYLGLYVCIRNCVFLIYNKGKGSCVQWWSCYAFLSYLSLVFIASVYFIIPERIDTIIYGRYSDWASIPIVLLGMFELFSKMATTQKKKLFVGFTIYTEIFLIIFWNVIKKWDLWFFFGTCCPIGLGFRDKMRCEVEWVLLMTQTVILISVVIWSVAGIQKKYMQIVCFQVLLLLGWYCVAKHAIMNDIQLGQKKEMLLWEETIKKEEISNIVYYTDLKVGCNPQVYTIQYLLGDIPIQVILGDKTFIEKINKDDYRLILVNNNEQLNEVINNLDIVQKTDMFVLGYYR